MIYISRVMSTFGKVLVLSSCYALASVYIVFVCTVSLSPRPVSCSINIMSLSLYASLLRPQSLICTADVIILSLYPCLLWLFSLAWNIKSHSVSAISLLPEASYFWCSALMILAFHINQFNLERWCLCPLLPYFSLLRPASSTWSISLGCTTGTPAHTPDRPSATSAERLCQASPPTVCPVKVRTHKYTSLELHLWSYVHAFKDTFPKWFNQ